MKNLQHLNKYRKPLWGHIGDDHNGMFIIPFKSYELHVVASDGDGWDHVSVSLNNRCPNWEEMNYIKDLFFEEDECVMQLHPPKKDYINNLQYCLHMWRPQDKEIPRPPLYMVTGRK